MELTRAHDSPRNTRNATIRDNVSKRQKMWVQSNTEMRSCNHRCCGKAVNITQPECVYL